MGCGAGIGAGAGAGAGAGLAGATGGVGLVTEDDPSIPPNPRSTAWATFTGAFDSESVAKSRGIAIVASSSSSYGAGSSCLLSGYIVAPH